MFGKLPPLIILTIAMLVIRYPLACFLIDRWQADAIWWSFPISSAFAAVLAVSYYKFGGWRRERMISSPLAAATGQT